MKVLLCCMACRPCRGSEPGMGWNFANAASTFCETHVIVSSGEREALQEYCDAHPEQAQNLHFHYFPLELWTGRMAAWVGNRIPSIYFYIVYNKWLRQVAQYAEKLDKTEHFDLIHQVTLAGFRLPGYLWRLHKPLVWGPIGGIDNAPFRLLLALRVMDCVGYALRNIINIWQWHFGYAAREYAGHANYILTSTKEGEHVVRNIWKRPAEYMCEIGTWKGLSEKVAPMVHKEGTPLRVCWAGIMNNQRKNLPMLFRALDFCESPVEVCVMGAGAQQAAWEELAKRVPSRHRVEFLGSVPQSRVFEEMRRSHVFCITSVKDDTSSVLLEALQHGLPVIAPDSCGFSCVLTDECGIKISIDWPMAFARKYGQALERLACDENLRLSMAHGAIKRAEAFTWSSKTERLKEIYTSVTAGNIAGV